MKKRKMMIAYIIPAGIALIFLGVIIVFIGAMMQSSQSGKDSSKSSVHVGIGGFIGPIPFGFANSKTALYITVGAAVFFFILWIILRYTS